MKKSKKKLTLSKERIIDLNKISQIKGGARPLYDPTYAPTCNCTDDCDQLTDQGCV